MDKNREQFTFKNIHERLNIKPIIALLALGNVGIFAADPKTGTEIIPITLGLSALCLTADHLIKKSLININNQ